VQLRSGPNYLALLGLSSDVGAAPLFKVLPTFLAESGEGREHESRNLQLVLLCNGLPIELRWPTFASVTFVNSNEENLCEARSGSRVIRNGDIEAGSHFAQKRSVPRNFFVARTVVIEPITRAEPSTRTSDISLNGCYLESVDQFLPNTILRIRIEQKGQPVEIQGRVAHVQAGLGTGIAFFEYSAESRLTIESWISTSSSR